MPRKKKIPDSNRENPYWKIRPPKDDVTTKHSHLSEQKMNTRKTGMSYVEDPRGGPPNQLKRTKHSLEGFEKTAFPKRADKPLAMLRKEDRDKFRRPGFNPAVHDRAIAQYLGIHGYTPEGDQRTRRTFSKKEIRNNRLKILGILAGLGLTVFGAKKGKNILAARAGKRSYTDHSLAEQEKIRALLGKPGLIRKGSQLTLPLSTSINLDPSQWGMKRPGLDEHLYRAAIEGLRSTIRNKPILQGWAPSTQLNMFPKGTRPKRVKVRRLSYGQNKT